MSWIKHPTILHGRNVDLLPLEESHFEELSLLAKDDRIWELYQSDCTDTNTFYSVYQDALLEREKGNCYPFVIVSKATGKLVGSTRFHTIKPKDRKVEIGYTWLHPDYWATGINTECKFLLLTFCFETLGTIRVQFQANEINMRSRKAIEKLGAQFEGVLRKDKIRDNGIVRNSAYYSIIDDEWEEVKINLKKKIDQTYKANDRK